MRVCGWIANSLSDRGGTSRESRLLQMRHKREQQDVNRQVQELKAVGAEVVYIEYEHGDSKIKSQ